MFWCFSWFDVVDDYHICREYFARKSTEILLYAIYKIISLTNQAELGSVYQAYNDNIMARQFREEQ